MRRDHNLAVVRVTEPGEDLRGLVRSRLRELCLHRVDVVYVDPPLSHPATGTDGDWLEDPGFFFDRILAEAQDGDVLRLQYLNNVEIEKDDVVRTASNFVQDLLNRIFEQRDVLTKR